MLRRHLAITGLFIFLTLALTWPLPLHLDDAIPGDSFDGWQNYWNLWWVKTAMLDQHTHPYFTDALYHPTGVSLWFQTINIFNGLTSLPVQLAGNLFWAYNFIVLFSFTMAGYGATLLAALSLRRAGARPGRALWSGAILAGVIYTFAPFHFAHLLGHMQVFSLEFIPFYALYLLLALTPGTTEIAWRKSIMAGIFLILAALCDWYFGLYLGLFSVLYVFWLLLRRQFRWAHLASLAIIGGLTLIFTGPLLAPMVRESIQHDFMKPPPGQIVDLSADVLSFLIPSIQHPIWGDLAATLRANLSASPSENTLYMGLIPLLLALTALFKRQLRLGFWALAAVVFAIFALGPVLHFAGENTGIPMPYALLLRLPFIEIARTVARYDLLVMLAVGILAGGGLYVLLAKRYRWWLTMGVFILVLFEFLPLPYPISLPDTPVWYKTLAAESGSGAVLNLPMNWDRPGYLLYQTIHTKPLTAGYISRNDPRTLPPRIPIISDFRHLGPDINAVPTTSHAPTILAFMDIDWVIVDRYKMPGGATREHTDALIQDIFVGRTPIYEDNRLSVYETWPPDIRLPFIEIGYDWGPLQSGPQRQVFGSASIIIHSPDGAPQMLTITPTTGNAISFWLKDESGRETGRSDGESLSIPLNLKPGPNHFTLHSDRVGVTIHAISLIKIED